MRVEFNTRDYTWAHGKSPRGTGSWAFRMNGETVFAPMMQTYAQAKAWAAGEAKRRNCRQVEVCS